MCTPDDLYVKDGLAHARATRVVASLDTPHFVAETPADLSWEVDVVWMRKDPPFDIEYIFATYVLDLVPPSTLVLNDPGSSATRTTLRDAVPGALSTHAVDAGHRQGDAVRGGRAGRIVIKPWDGNGGRGVLVTERGDGTCVHARTAHRRRQRSHHRSALHPRDQAGRQAHHPHRWRARGLDLRVPGERDHRGNMHVGASVQATTLSETDRAICAAIGPHLKRMGPLFVGIDTIGPYLTEINVTSPTGIREINRLMDIHLERDLTDAVARMVRQHKERNP